MRAPSVQALLDKLRLRKRSYQALFGPNGLAGSDVMHDLARFCRAFETCVVPGDDAMTKVLEGRREVWLRIVAHLHLEPAELAGLYGMVVEKQLSEGER